MAIVDGFHRTVGYLRAAADDNRNLCCASRLTDDVTFLPRGGPLSLGMAGNCSDSRNHASFASQGPCYCDVATNNVSTDAKWCATIRAAEGCSQRDKGSETTT